MHVVAIFMLGPTMDTARMQKDIAWIFLHSKHFLNNFFCYWYGIVMIEDKLENISFEKSNIRKNSTRVAIQAGKTLPCKRMLQYLIDIKASINNYFSLFRLFTKIP